MVILSYKSQEMKDSREVGKNSEYVEWFLKVLTGQSWVRCWMV